MQHHIPACEGFKYTAENTSLPEKADFEVIEFRNNVYDVLDKAEPLSVLDLDINGHDLQKISIQPGKEMGVILNALLDVVLENPDLNNKNVLIDIVRNRD